MNNLLSTYNSIRLEEMTKVKLMNRVDTKYVTTPALLMNFLELARPYYRVQEIDDKRICSYRTEYFDTKRMDMYNMHHRGCLGRQKIRIRTYEDSNLSFLEVKTKNNHRRTKKKRISLSANQSVIDKDCASFISQKSWFEPYDLIPALNNRFCRVTLVNSDMTERLTIDTNLRYDNPLTDNLFCYEGVCIIEIKRDGLSYSPAVELLRRLRIFPHGFSKYCMGCAITNPNLKTNRFKTKLVEIDKIRKN